MLSYAVEGGRATAVDTRRRTGNTSDDVGKGSVVQTRLNRSRLMSDDVGKGSVVQTQLNRSRLMSDDVGKGSVVQTRLNRSRLVSDDVGKAACSSTSSPLKTPDSLLMSEPLDDSLFDGELDWIGASPLEHVSTVAN